MDCNFSDSATMLRDIFVIGVANDRLGKHLLTEDASTLTFDAAVERAFHDWRRVQPATFSHTTQANVCKLNQSQTKPANQPNTVTCYRCGSSSHKANSLNCKAINATCNRCSKKGHFQRVCKANVSDDRKGNRHHAAIQSECI